MQQWPLPANLKGLWGFLGLTGYYRKFVRDYGGAAPLTTMRKKNSFHWTEEALEALQSLKKAMTEPPVLALLNFAKPFVTESDASGKGIGAVLMPEGRPIAFLSQALKGKALNLSTYEKELLALVLCVQKWRPYLLGHRFFLFSPKLEIFVGTEDRNSHLTKLVD